MATGNTVKLVKAGGRKVKAMTMAPQRPQAPVATVDPRRLRKAFAMVAEWSDDGDEEAEGETAPTVGHDLHALLDSVAREFRADEAETIALFKRALALMTFCDDERLPERLFEEGMPGMALCEAASKVAVLELPEADGTVMGHALDPAGMRAALPAIWN